ncbi:MAG: hypothetical protein U0263_06745 [Polyangiaceae bacterium]
MLRDGDFVTAASGIASESLVAFLTARGTLSPDVQKALGHKLPAFGRHAGAALIAHGHLRQDELWPVLRSHAEWLVGRVLEMTAGGASIERDVPARLEAEPAVLGAPRAPKCTSRSCAASSRRRRPSCGSEGSAPA